MVCSYENVEEELVWAEGWQLTVSSVEQEIKEFQMMDTTDNTDLLKWWLGQKERLPILAKVVREVFAIPASSATSERVFSVGTQVRYIKIMKSYSSETYA